MAVATTNAPAFSGLSRTVQKGQLTNAFPFLDIIDA
jgi:hypothetical protein